MARWASARLRNTREVRVQFPRRDKRLHAANTLIHIVSDTHDTWIPSVGSGLCTRLYGVKKI